MRETAHIERMESYPVFIQETISGDSEEVSAYEQMQESIDSGRRAFANMRADYQQRLAQIRSRHPTLIMYMPALMAAGLKDMLDAPVNLTMIGSGILSAFFGTIIFVQLMRIKTNSSVMESRFLVKKAIQRLVVVVGFSAADALPGVGFFPLELAAVFFIFVLDRLASTKFISQFIAAYEIAEKKMKRHSKMEGASLE